MSKIKDQLLTNTTTVQYSEATMTDNILMATDDGFAQAATEADRHVIEGEILKFVEGVWAIAKQPVPAGTQFIPVKLRMAWVKWVDHKPVKRVWPKSNGSLPSRESLGDNDENDWSAGLDDKLEDPWKNTRYIYLLNTRTAEIVTFPNSTFGMRQFFDALATNVSRMRTAYPSAFPVVELGSMLMKKYNTLRPHLQIVGWKQGGQLEEPTKQIAAPKSTNGYRSSKDDSVMDDEIPF